MNFTLPSAAHPGASADMPAESPNSPAAPSAMVRKIALAFMMTLLTDGFRPRLLYAPAVYTCEAWERRGSRSTGLRIAPRRCYAPIDSCASHACAPHAPPSADIAPDRGAPARPRHQSVRAAAPILLRLGRERAQRSL